MIGTIRKHSSWLWWVVATLTIISFVIFMGNPGTRGGGGRNTGLGVIYGQTVTAEDFDAAKREFFIYYWLHYGEFPDRTASLSKSDIERETYVRLMLTGKAKELGIHVSAETQVAGANDLLRTMGRDGKAVPMGQFLEKVLAPEGLTAGDFQRFVVDDLTIQQMVQSLGLAGALIPPQAAGQLFDREHQDVSAQAVFFSASNYLAEVVATPAAVSLFYTNYMAHYRLPDRVQINYLQFDLTNYLAEAEQKAGKTNITAQAEAYYAQHSAEFADAKTPAEAKAKIRDIILRQDAGAVAVEKARDFLKELFLMEPLSPANLATLAGKHNLKVHSTAPFTEAEGPEEFPAPADLTKTAFKLNPDSPFSTRPIPGAESVYVIGLANSVPSSIPPLSEIRDRVAHDYQNVEATLRARRAGTNFYYTAGIQMAADKGKTFAQAALAAGQSPIALRAFSLSSQSIPEAEGRADVQEIKRAAFTTQPGHLSPFQDTADGGFVIFVQSLLPVDETLKKAKLPDFLSQVRRSRQNEAFNLWVESEAGRELRNTPYYEEMARAKTAPRTP